MTTVETINAALTALNLMNELVRQATAIGSALQSAHERGTTLSLGELRQIVATRNAAIGKLDADIALAEAEGR